MTYHVDNGQDTRTVSELLANGGEVARPVNADDAEGDVGAKVEGQEDELQTGGQSTNVDGRRELDLLVVALATDGCVPDVLLEAGKRPRRHSKVSLGVVVEAGDVAHVLDRLGADSPTGHEHDQSSQDEINVMIEHSIGVLGLGLLCLHGWTGGLGLAVDQTRHGHGSQEDVSERRHDEESRYISQVAGAGR
jgi:hypothetical protein